MCLDSLTRMWMWQLLSPKCKNDCKYPNIAITRCLTQFQVGPWHPGGAEVWIFYWGCRTGESRVSADLQGWDVQNKLQISATQFWNINFLTMHNIQFQPPLNRYQVVALREVLFIKYLLPKTLHFLLKGWRVKACGVWFMSNQYCICACYGVKSQSETFVAKWGKKLHFSAKMNTTPSHHRSPHHCIVALL